MRKKIFMMLLLLVFAGCNEKRSKIEVIPNYKKIYLSETRVTERAKPIDKNFSSDMIKSFKQILQKVIKSENIKENDFFIEYILYINEKGKVDKISGDENEKFTNLILPVIEKWRFTPAKLNGKPVKSRKIIQADFILKDGMLVENKIDFEDTYFTELEKMPFPIGGMQGIQKKIKYTQAAIRSGIEGKIYISAFINKKGIVTKVKIIKGLGYGLDESALKAVKSTRFTPGKQKGKPVNAKVSIPIVFSLRN
ncbi:MAG TPA: energy transducer TonB [Ignavibacteria bacterium]|nr:energy transducer TonB [Ignavibacteria bacterium]